MPGLIGPPPVLSGSVANSEDVAEWMRRLGRRVEVVATKERPVPLEEVAVLPLSAGVVGFPTVRVDAATEAAVRVGRVFDRAELGATA